MPLYKGIFYADGSTPMSAEGISSAQATSVGNAIENLATQVANSTARDEVFPVPVQGNAVWRMDRMWEERYFGLYNATTNPQGATVAGWYPTVGNLPRFKLARNATTGWTGATATWYSLNNNAVWDVQTDDKSGTIYRDTTMKFYVTQPGLYQINAQLNSNATGALFAVKINSSAASSAGIDYAAVGAAVSSWCRPNIVHKVKLLTGDYISFAHYGLGAHTYEVAGTTGTSYLEMQYIGPA